MTDSQPFQRLRKIDIITAHPNKLLVGALIAIFAFGAIIRITPIASLNPTTKIVPHAPTGAFIGHDEDFYRRYLTMIDAKGLSGYPATVRTYVAAQRDLNWAIIPPTRVTFIASAYLWQFVSRSSPLSSLHAVSCLFTVLGLAVAGVFAWRLGGLPKALGITALMSCAPLQIQMAQRAYIDGVFACCALLTLWMLWENLRAPNHYGWLAGYIVSMALMVMTKENAAFVFVSIIGIIVLNAWISIGKITAALLVASLLGLLLGLFVLTLAAGGINTLAEVYRINVEKSYLTSYAVQTGDGPWFRYALDLLIMSPVVTLLAIAGFLNFEQYDKPTAYFAFILVLTYVVMANVRYGMNLRYASIWDMPLRWIALGQLTAIAGTIPQRFGRFFIVFGVALLCLVDLRQYLLFFAENGIYDPIPESMLRALNILK